MKRYFALVLAMLISAFLGSARGQGLDDLYVQIYTLIQEADTVSSSEPATALAKYADAQNALLRLQKSSPDWNPKVVAFRLSYIAAKIGAISTNAAVAAPAPSATNAPPPAAGVVAPPATNAVTAPAPAVQELQARIATLSEQVRVLQAERIVMEAKLKEALSVQPASADPGELAKAEDRIKALQKENELLKVAFEAEKAKPAVDTKALDASRQSLAEANRQLEEQKQVAAKLTVERDALQAKAKANPDTAALVAENQLLKQKLTSTAPAAGEDTTRKLSQAQAQIAVLQSDKELLRTENAALANRLKQVSTNTVASSVLPPAEVASTLQVRQLERQRDDLQKKLDAANKALYGRKGKSAAAQVQQLELELSAARARLEVCEARQVPYSAEELALLKAPEPALAAAPAKPARKPMTELPAGSSRLVTEAQTWFASRQFDKAETAYLEVVRMDPRNVPALANLAVVQIEAGHLDSAEKNVKSALAENPDDAFSLRTLGILKFRQAKYDEALDALSRAAKAEPDNPEIQNYLGLVLSEKGLRGPAETALRKAVQLQPNYAGAHYNLAIVYLSQQPPATELARWHYQKALSAGHAANADVEKKLNGK